MNIREAKTQIFDDQEILAQHVADWLCALAAAKEGKFTVALSGGSTPKRLYECLAETRFLDAFPWQRTHWFWGDERCVPPDDDQSNFKMAREAFLQHAPIPPNHIHPVPTSGLTPDQSASLYEDELKEFYGAATLDAARPFFDVVFLGLGPDGHTASLFPHTHVLSVRDHWVSAVTDGDKGPV